MTVEFRRRHIALRAKLAESTADSLVVTHLPNVFYLTGFTGSAGVVTLKGHRCTLFTDGRYATQAPEETKSAGVKIAIAKGSLLQAAGHDFGGKSRSRVVFDPAHTTVAALRSLESAAGNKVSWQAESGWIEELRSVKSADEISRLRAAAKLISQVFESVLPIIRPGLRERELAAEIEYKMKKLGAEGPAFDTIVASGKRSALPHARPTERRLKRNELVVLDLGAILARYCSDLTRTVYLGRAPKRIKNWYRAVLEAQEAGREALGEGVECGAADSAARAVLALYGFADYFTHSLGHGLGLEIHEDPRLAAGQKRLLHAGNIVTVEPGVYMEGLGGIRVEDDVLIKKSGVEVLTTATREFLEL